MTKESLNLLIKKSKKDLPEIDKPRYDRRNRRNVTTKYEAKPIEVFEVPTFKKLRIMKKEINVSSFRRKRSSF